MNIAELAENHLDALLEHTLKGHREHIAIIERALAGDEQARSIYREMAKTISADLHGGTVQ